MRLPFWRRRRDQELREEIESHLEMAKRDRIERGQTAPQAESSARRELGNAGLIREVTRDQWGWRWLEQLFQDLRYGVRMLRKTPGFTAIAVLTLALGIGANTAIFSIVNAVLLRPLPYPHADRLVFLSEWSQQIPGMSISMENFKDWRAENTVFESMVAYSPINVALTGQGEAERLFMRQVTAGLFPTLGVKPILGRPLTPDDDKVGAIPVVLLSDGLWASKFDRDPNIIGKHLTLDGESFTVIGVLPSSRFHESWQLFDLFSSLGRLEDTIGGPTRRGEHPGIYAYARMKPRVTLAQARTEMLTIAARLARQYPQNTGNSIVVQPLLNAIVDDVRPSLLVLMGAVGFVLLIGCVNVANLLMARASDRQKEVAIRKALGAGRARLIRQLLTESVLLALLGGFVGLLMAVWATQAMAAAASGIVPRIGDVSLDRSVLFFTLGISCLTGLFFGVFPAFQVSRTDVNEALKESARGSGTEVGRRRLRDALVVGELAVSLVLLVGAGLTLKSLFHVLQADAGFQPRGVLTASFSLPETRYKNDAQRRLFFQQLTEKIAALPAVAASGVKNPLLGGWQTSVYLDGRPTPQPGHLQGTEISRVTPGALPAMGVRLLRGRFFTQEDNEKAPKVCIVDDTMVQHFWPGEDPIGKRIILSGPPKPGEELPPTTVVGVVHQVKNYGTDQPTLVETFIPQAQSPSSGGNLVILTKTDPAGLAAAVRAAVRSLDPDLPLFNVRKLQDVVGENVAPRRLSVLLLSSFAGLALLLAGVGIYGVMSYTVTQRIHEIGIRIALGAEPGEVLRLILGQGTRLALFGVAIGVVLASVLMRLLTSILFEVSATDPLTFVSVVVLLVLVALAACYIPARRAMRVDPMVALRYE